MSQQQFLRSRVSDELKQKFDAKAKAVGVSPSDLLRLLATQATEDVALENAPPAEAEKPRKEGQVWFRLTKAEHAQLKALGRAYGMTYNQYAALLVRAKLSGASIPTDAELRALEAANYELMAVGRNLNQVAHALNLKLKAHGYTDESDRASITEELLAQLASGVERQQERIEALLDAMQQRGQ